MSSLTSWPSKFVASSPCPTDHLCQLASKLVCIKCYHNRNETIAHIQICSFYTAREKFVWPWTMTSWPPKFVASCPVDHLCKLASKLVVRFQNIVFKSLVTDKWMEETLRLHLTVWPGRKKHNYKLISKYTFSTHHGMLCQAVTFLKCHKMMFAVYI